MYKINLFHIYFSNHADMFFLTGQQVLFFEYKNIVWEYEIPRLKQDPV